MLEALLAATATSGLFVLARGQHRSLTTDERVVEYAVSEVNDEDLPCPWCYAQTAEGDTRCRSCGRKFG